MNLELFAPEACDNMLPYDGVVRDYGLILQADQAQQYFSELLADLAWQQDEVIVHGQYFKTERKVVWSGDENYPYQYSGMVKQALPWHPLLLQLKQQIGQMTGQQYNSCFANLYANGTQAVGWHSDDEPALYADSQPHTVIASLSLGATRKFRLKHKYQAEQVDLLLQTGQLIVMSGQTQLYWKHCIAKSSKIIDPRINLTFRYFYQKAQ